jgi:hypothetical protein
LDKLAAIATRRSKGMADTMLAEIFVLRLEAIARARRDATRADERHVRFDPAVSFEFKDSRKNSGR